MSAEKELYTYFKSFPFETFMLAWKEKMERYGHASGKIRIELNNQNRECISNFLGKNLQQLSCTEIRYAQVIKAIANSRFEGADFNAVIRMYFNDELLTKKQKKEMQEEKHFRIISELLEKYKDTKAYEWLLYCVNEKGPVYIRMIQEINSNAHEFKQMCDDVMKGINHFPVWKNQSLKMSVFAAQITGDPHAFDNDRFTNYLLYHSICFFTQTIYERKTLLDRNLLFYKMGLLQEDVNNFCMIAHLLAFDLNREIHEGWKSFYERFEIWNVNVLNLNAISQIDSKCCTKVLVIENPSVFQELVDYSEKMQLTEFGFVCTNGNLNFCGYLLLDKIQKAGIRMYYCGDFDPEGLLIADKLKERYSDDIEFWRYSVQDYHRAQSKRIVDAKRCSKLEHLKYPQTKEIGNLIKTQTFAGYQENLLDLYKQDLIEWTKEMNIPEESGYYVYLIRCEDDSLYCGWTTNLIKRFKAHQSGKGAKYTKSHKPVEIFYYESFDNSINARKREYEIKQMSHKEKLLLKK